MANYTVPTGQTSYGNTLTANPADAVTFADRYNYVTVTNLGTTGAIYVTGNGVAPTGDSTGAINGEQAVMPGTSVAVAAGDIFWSQAQRVIPVGVIEMGNGTAYNAVTNPS